MNDSWVHVLVLTAKNLSIYGLQKKSVERKKLFKCALWCLASLTKPPCSSIECGFDNDHCLRRVKSCVEQLHDDLTFKMFQPGFILLSILEKGTISNYKNKWWRYNQPINVSRQIKSLFSSQQAKQNRYSSTDVSLQSLVSMQNGPLTMSFIEQPESHSSPVSALSFELSEKRHAHYIHSF